MMTSQNKVSIQVKLSHRDSLQGYRLYRVRDSVDNVGHIVLGFTSLLMGILLVVVQLLSRSQESIPDSARLITWFSFIAGPIFIFDLIPIAFTWLQHRQFMKEFPEPYQITFDENGVGLRTQHLNATYDWKFFHAALEGKTLFILLYGKRSYLTIPKAAFQTEEVMDTVRNLLKIKLASYKEKLMV